MNRFTNHFGLPDFGPLEQQKLQKAHVLLVGAGGLGCPIALYLASAGIGKMTIVDGDHVEKSNLNRQIAYGENHIGLSKSKVLSEQLLEKYSDIEVIGIHEYASEQNVLEWVKEADLVIDATDRFNSRYLLSDACKKEHKPLILGAVHSYEGQVFCFTCDQQLSDSNYYRDLFPNPPQLGEIPTCNDTGVLGVLTGIIGCMMAYECIKHFISVIDHNYILYYDLKNYNISKFTIN